MKFLLTKCATCHQQLHTAYKNAYCIPAQPETLRCQACENTDLAEVAPLATRVYYKHCDRCGPDTITYRVELSLNSQGHVAGKEIYKRRCDVSHSA